MTAAKARRIILGAACAVWLLLPHAGAASQTDDDDIYSIAWRPDGLQLATGHARGTVRLWDAVTGEPLITVQFPALDLGLHPPIDDVDWHPDGTRIAVMAGTTLYPRAFLWVLDAATGETLHDLEAGVMGHDAAWSPDGTLLAGAIVREFAVPIAGKPAESGANIWNTTTGQLVAELTADTHDVIFQVAWSPDGSRLASTGWAQTIIWDVETWTPLVTIGGAPHPTPFWVTWSPDGSRVATPGIDGLAYIWESATGSLLITLQSGDEDQLRQIEWQPGGDLLAGRSDHALVFWDATTGQQVDRMDTAGWMGYVAWSPDGSRLVYSDHRTEHPQEAEVPGRSG